MGSAQAAAALSPSSAGVNQQFPPVCTIAAFLSLSPSHLQIKILTCLWMCQRLQSHNSVLVSFGVIAKRFVDFVAVLPLVILWTLCQLSSRSTHSPFRGNSLSQFQVVLFHLAQFALYQWASSSCHVFQFCFSHFRSVRCLFTAAQHKEYQSARMTGE